MKSINYRSYHFCKSCNTTLDQTCVYIPYPRTNDDVLCCIACDRRTKRVDCWVPNHPRWRDDCRKAGVVYV